MRGSESFNTSRGGHNRRIDDRDDRDSRSKKSDSKPERSDEEEERAQKKKTKDYDGVKCEEMDIKWGDAPRQPRIKEKFKTPFDESERSRERNNESFRSNRNAEQQHSNSFNEKEKNRKGIDDSRSNVNDSRRENARRRNSSEEEDERAKQVPKFGGSEVTSTKDGPKLGKGSPPPKPPTHQKTSFKDAFEEVPKAAHQQPQASKQPSNHQEKKGLPEIRNTSDKMNVTFGDEESIVLDDRKDHSNSRDSPTPSPEPQKETSGRVQLKNSSNAYVPKDKDSNNSRNLPSKDSDSNAQGDRYKFSKRSEEDRPSGSGRGGRGGGKWHNERDKESDEEDFNKKYTQSTRGGYGGSSNTSMRGSESFNTGAREYNFSKGGDTKTSNRWDNRELEDRNDKSQQRRTAETVKGGRGRGSRF